MLNTKFGWNWPSGSVEGDFENFINAFSLYHYLVFLPLEKGVALYLNKLESTLSRDALWKVWLKLAHWFWRRRFLNFVSFCYYLPLEKGVVLHLNNLNPLHPRMLCAKFGWNWLSGSSEEENRKTTTTDNGQIVFKKLWLRWQKIYTIHKSEINVLGGRCVWRCDCQCVWGGGV